MRGGIVGAALKEEWAFTAALGVACAVSGIVAAAGDGLEIVQRPDEAFFC